MKRKSGWRLGLALAAALAVGLLAWSVLLLLFFRWNDPWDPFNGPLFSMFERVYLMCEPLIGHAPSAYLMLCIIALFPMLAAAGAFAFLLKRLGLLRRELRCLRCAHRLHGLSEPRCPACGEAI